MLSPTALWQLLSDEVYSPEQIRIGLRHPHLVLTKVNTFYNHWRTGCRYNPEGIDIFEEDWDNLLILDACRYDAFRARADLPGETQKRTSRGSTSSEFIRGNFSGKTLHDVAYVSANGWYRTLKDEIGAEVYAFEIVDRDAKQGLTSRPETVAAAAREALDSYPEKRLIAHFMQPHSPYLGPTGERFDVEAELAVTLEKSGLTQRDLLRAYRENLDLVLSEVASLLNDLPGRTVVTADHGELLGAKQRPLPVKGYTHPEGVYVDELVTVPWHVHENGDRRTITADDPIGIMGESDLDAVQQNLRDLGYKM